MQKEHICSKFMQKKKRLTVLEKVQRMSPSVLYIVLRFVFDVFAAERIFTLSCKAQKKSLCFVTVESEICSSLAFVIFLWAEMWEVWP